MAELASGAVSSLLGVIRNEAALLGGVRGDMQFIKEEMESMNSFLLYLAKTVPADGDHDEQVHTWMNQVRLFASDCNNCIDLYLYRGNPDIHLPKGGLQRYLRWTPWFLQRMVAQHRAALKLRVLKDRARDIGERRLRYGVEVPAKALAAAAAAAGGLPVAGPLSLPYAATAEAAAYQDMDDQVVATAMTDRSGPRGALLGLHILELEDYFSGRLAEWIKLVHQGNIVTVAPGSIPSIAIVAWGNVAGTLAREALAVAKTHFQHGILVDIPAVHHWWLQLRTEDILCYIWRDLEQSKHQSQQQGTTQGFHWCSKGKRGISRERNAAIHQIEKNIQHVMKVEDKIEGIHREIRQVKSAQLAQDLQLLKEMKNKVVESKISNKTLAILLLLLLKSTAAEAVQTTLGERYNKIIEITSKKLKDHMEVKEAAATEGMIQFDEPEKKYETILREVFPNNSNNQMPQQAELQDTGSSTATASTTALGEEQIKAMIQKAKQEILDEVQEKLDTLQRLQEGRTDKEQASGKPDSQGQILEAVITEENKVKTEKIQGQDATEETTKREENKDPISQTDIAEITKKIKTIQEKIKEQMKTKAILDKIQIHLKHENTLVILKTGWYRNAFNNLLSCVASAMIVITPNNPQEAKEYCNPLCEAMEYSLVGLYHDIVLQLRRKQMNEEGHDPDSKILREILKECEPHEFCMKIFVHALYAKPRRSNEELRKLHTSLKTVSPKSLASIATMILKFSYKDLQKEYKSCLLYLAIYPPGRKISGSTLIERWVVEGMITTEDWRWSSSVHKAKLCFDELINRGLVYPADVGATGEIKSCMVGELVHEFITKTAEKQHVVETRLSRHLARHFSISNDLRLRGSDKIEDFLKKLSESSQFYLLKVLDLEGCHCFGGKNKRYLKDICCKINLLKYLKLRRTDVVQLPDEINNLQELEVLDIRQTSVHKSSTRKLRLLKLKRLLVGDIDPSPSSDTDTGTATRVETFPSSTYIPEKVEKMENMEVLSNVMPQTIQDLRDIGTLWQLRKLGVVIEDKETHLKTLLEAISNLSQCIRSLSITFLPQTRHEATPSCRWLLQATDAGSNSHYKLDDLPKVLLESLSIRGTSQQKAELLQLLLPSENSHLTKITLSNTSLSQKDLEVLSKQPMLRCVKLRCIEYTGNKLTFKKDEFQKLKYFLIEVSKMTEIIFDDGATVELEKMVLPLTEGLNLSGLNKLLRLEELELNDSNNKSNNSTTSNNNDINSRGNNGDDFNRNSITTATGAGATAADSVATAPTNDTTTIAAHTAVPNIAPNTNITDANTHTNATMPDAAATTATMTAASASTRTTNTNTTATATTDTKATAVTGATAATTVPTNSNIIKNNMLHSLFDNAKRITKVTLHGTMLKQDGLQILANKPNIRCLVLSEKSHDESQLTFDKKDFPNLNLLIVECSNITKINFTAGSCPKLEKFVWTFTFTFTNIEPLNGIDNLLRLKEVEFNGEFVHDEVKQKIKRHKNKPYFTHYKPEKKVDQREGSMVPQTHGTKNSCFQRHKGLHQKRN